MDMTHINTGDLEAELTRRELVMEAEFHVQRMRDAKYFCYACGMPDSWHTKDCPPDIDCT